MRSPRPSSTPPASFAMQTEMRSFGSVLRWLSGSKSRSDSTSPSKTSIRSGSSLANGNRSRMSPRRLTSPGASASGWRV